MDRWSAGDEGAFDALYRELSPRMWAYSLRLCRDPHEAEDVFQEAWCKMQRSRGTFVRGSNAISWSMSVLRSTFLDELRRKRRRVPVDCFADGKSVVGHPSASPDASMQVHQTIDRFVETLRTLPLRQREAWALTREQGLSMADAAAILGTTTTAVKLRVHRALESLRAVLADGAG